MLKSVTAIIIVGLGLKDTKALWALTVLVGVAVTGVAHLSTQDHIGPVRAVGDLALLDAVGSLAYVVGAFAF